MQALTDWRVSMICLKTTTYRVLAKPQWLWNHLLVPNSRDCLRLFMRDEVSAKSSSLQL